MSDTSKEIGPPSLEVKLARMDDGARMPTKGSQHAAGLDLYALENTTVHFRSSTKPRTGIRVAIPFGFGYKFNVYDVLTLSVNISWRITFTDYLDDVSTTYIDASRLDEIDAELVDQSNKKFTPGFQRGNPYNNDKYGFLAPVALCF